MKIQTDKTAIKGFLFAILAAALWGVSGTFGQFLFQERDIDVTWLITARLQVSGILLLLYARFREKADIFSIWRDKKSTINLLIFSITGMLAVQYTYFAAIKHSNAATATILQYAGPIIIAVYLAIKYRRLPQPKELFAIFLAVLGTFLLVTQGKFNSLSISPIALFFGLASAVALAIYTLQPKELLSKYRASVVIGWGMLCGGIAISFIKAPWNVDGVWDIYSYLYTGLIIIFGTLVAFTLYLYAVKVIGGQKASLLASAEPLAATIVSVYWLQITFTLTDWIGSLCIIFTVFLLGKGNQKI